MQHRLPPELWGHIFSFFTSPESLCSASIASRTFSDEIAAPHANPVWRRLWDSSARINSHALPSWAHVPGLWREQVAASYRLLRLPSCLKNAPSSPNCICVPPRYTKDGHHHTSDALFMPAGRIDVEDALGRAVCVQALGKAVVIAFEHGVGIVIRTWQPASHIVPKGIIAKRTGLASRPAFFFDDAQYLHNVILFAQRPTSTGHVLAVTANCNLIRIEIDVQKRRPFKCTLLDSFPYENGVPIQFTLSEDDQYILVGFSDGRVRMTDVAHGQCRVAFSIAGPVEVLAASGKWVVAGTSFDPIHLGVWDLTQHQYTHSITRTSSSAWGKVESIASMIATPSEDIFALWNGANAIRLLNAKTGEIGRVIQVNSDYNTAHRTVAEEGDHGASCVQFGSARMALTADKKRAAVASSNRVFLVSLSRGRGWLQSCQLNEARRSSLAFSNDDRVLVTAEGHAYGALSTKVMGQTSLSTPPKLKFWDTKDGSLKGEIEALAPVTHLSVCGDTVAAVCGAVGQVMILFGKPR